MSRTDYDEVWEKQSDGSMKLVEQTERVVSDEEIEKERRPERLRELTKKSVADMTPAEKDDLLELIALRLGKKFP